MRNSSSVLVSAVVSGLLGCQGAAESDETVGLDDSEREMLLSQLGPLPETAPSAGNAYADDPAAARLGHKLFFEPRYSASGEVSCATCHDPATGFQDGRGNTSLGIGHTGRHTATLINVAHRSGDAFASWQSWDGRTDSLWSQALASSEDPIEMGGSRSRIALLMYDKYRAEYEAVFGPMVALRDGDGAPLASAAAMPGTSAWEDLEPAVQTAITEVFVNFGKAIAAYERQIENRDAPFDRFWSDLDAGATTSDALTDNEVLGLKVFMGKGGCVSCHSGPAFTDASFANIGISQVGPNLPEADAGRAVGIAAVVASEFNCAAAWSDASDKSACAVASMSTSDADLGAFKVPGLRGVSGTAPYMHTGTLLSLEEVMLHYNRGGDAWGFAGAVHPAVQPLGMTGEEMTAVIDFLGALSGQGPDAALLEAPALPE